MSIDNSLWEKFSLALVDPNSDQWFEDFNPIPVSTHYGSKFRESSQAYGLFSHAAYEDLSVVPAFELTEDSLGKIQVIPETKLGQVVNSFLKASEIGMEYKTLWPVSHEAQAELDLKVRLEGQWGTEAGTPFLQSFEVYEDSNGRVSGYWFVDLLACPVPLEPYNIFEVETDSGEIETHSLSDRGMGWTLGQLSVYLQIPNFIKRLAYLCETPFPSTQIMSLTRNMAFGEVPKKAWPEPFFMVLKNGLVQGYSKTLSRTHGGNRYDGSLFPNSVRFGWRLGEEAIPHLTEIMPVLINGCSFAMSTVEDGFENFRAIDYPYTWDPALGSPCASLVGYQNGGGGRGGAPQWIPNTHIGDIVSQTEALYRQAALAEEDGRDEDARQLLETLVANGAGPYLAHGINTYIYSHKLRDLIADPAELWDIEMMAMQVIDFDMMGQSTNACTNLGIAYFLAGELDLSAESLQTALQREDKFSEAEASFFLSLVEQKRGNSDAAAKYSNRCKLAGGYEPPNWIVSGAETGGQRDGNAPEAVNLAKFCSSCGQAFADSLQKFCTSCGQKRS